MAQILVLWANGELRAFLGWWRAERARGVVQAQADAPQEPGTRRRGLVAPEARLHARMPALVGSERAQAG